MIILTDKTENFKLFASSSCRSGSLSLLSCYLPSLSLLIRVLYIISILMYFAFFHQRTRDTIDLFYLKSLGRSEKFTIKKAYQLMRGALNDENDQQFWIWLWQEDTLIPKLEMFVWRCYWKGFTSTVSSGGVHQNSIPSVQAFFVKRRMKLSLIVLLVLSSGQQGTT